MYYTFEKDYQHTPIFRIILNPDYIAATSHNFCRVNQSIVIVFLSPSVLDFDQITLT